MKQAMNTNSNSEFYAMSFSSSLEDTSLQQAEDESFCEYDYDSDYQEEEEETSASEVKDAVMVESTTRNQVEIIFPVQHEEGWQLQPPLSPFSDLLPTRPSSAVARQKQESNVSSKASFSFVPVEAPSYANILASGANQQIQNANSMMTTSSWSHIDHSDSAGVQSVSSTMMNTVMTSKSVISAFELVASADGSSYARCKACSFLNKKDGKIGLCRGCSAVLVSNPCLEMDEALAMTLQQKEEKDALVRRKWIVSYQTPPFVRAQALAVEVASMMLRRGDDGNLSSATCNSTLDINQPECFACHPMKEMDLKFHASNFIDRLEFLRSDGHGFRLVLGYAFSLKTNVAEIYRDGLPERNCRRLIVSTDPEVAFRLKNGLTPVSTTPPPVDEPSGQYNEDACVGWIVAVVTSLDDYHDWSTVEHKNNEQENPQKIEILNKEPSNSCQCLPLAYFDAKHRKDTRIASLFQGLSDVCFDFFYTDWSLITIDEEQEDDECERDQGDNANEKNGAALSGSTETTTSDERLCKVDSLDEKDSEALNRMTTPNMENAPAGYCSSDDDTDEDNESNASSH